MDASLIGLILIISFLIFLFVGMPIFAALGLASVIGILLMQGPRGLGAVPSIIYDRTAGFVIVAVPLFILMGGIIFRTGIGTDLYTFAYRFLNRLPGSLAMATVAACAVFGAMCGLSLAAAATIGSFSIPEMLIEAMTKNYRSGVFALQQPCHSNSPSVPMVLYAVMADESVGKLFMAGIIPGIILSMMMMIYIGVFC